MAERDTSRFAISTTTSTSELLGVSSYREVKIALEQDFSLVRTVRGVGTASLGVNIRDANGVGVDATGDVLVEIYDAFESLLFSDVETKTDSATGQYTYNYTPPANSALGVYRAVHTFTVSGSAGEIEEWFRVVGNTPGDYSGKVIRGEETWTGTANIRNNLGQNVDPDSSSVKYTIRNPRGIILVNNADATRLGVGQYSASFAPGYNDSLDTYHVTFTYAINSVAGSVELFFTVAQRNEELVVDADAFKKSPEWMSVESLIPTWTDEQIEQVLAEAQEKVESWTGQRLGKTLITGERQLASINAKGQLFAQLNSPPVYKLIRALLRYHPTLTALTLPVSGFEIYHNLGQIKYLLQSGVPLATHVDNLLAEYAFTDNVELILDYECGYDAGEVPRVVKQAIRILATGAINEASDANGIKSVKSGDHSVSYFESKEPSGGGALFSLTKYEKRAFTILDMAGKIPPEVV